jgi:fructose-1,6-bisphosphatase/inositol monophosphatase family enzyme
VVDPIDGTKNYIRGVPVWATLIALLIDDEVVIGCVSAPALGRRWWAGKGGGAWTGKSLMAARAVPRLRRQRHRGCVAVVRVARRLERDRAAGSDADADAPLLAHPCVR